MQEGLSKDPLGAERNAWRRRVIAAMTKEQQAAVLMSLPAKAQAAMLVCIAEVDHGLQLNLPRAPPTEQPKPAEDHKPATKKRKRPIPKGVPIMDFRPEEEEPPLPVRGINPWVRRSKPCETGDRLRWREQGLASEQDRTG